MYLDLLAALEGSWLGHAGRHSAWLYTAANLLHVLGAAFVVGGFVEAVARVGLDRKALRDHIARTEFQTIIGPVKFAGSENASVPGTVGQWIGGEFEVVWPANRATAKLEAPKPGWK